MMKGSPIFLSLILLISIIQYLNSVDSLPEEPHDSMRLELIHRHAPQHNAKPKTQLESIKELLHNDNIRLNMISHKVGLSQRTRRKASEMSTSNGDAVMSMYSGMDYVPGGYFAEFKVGTPFQKFKMIVDTGSGLTWLNCRYQSNDNNRYQCGDANCKNHKRVFLADFSSSFKPIPCHSPMCEVDLKEIGYRSTCPTPLTPCTYGTGYADGSETNGFLVNETVTISLTNGSKAKIENVIIGCSNSFEGIGSEKTDGLIGLGYNKYGFTSKVTERFGGKFSYCLVDHWSHKNVSNYLIFGANYNKTSLLSNMQYTKLELITSIGGLYVLNMVGISIGGVLLKIPSEAWKTKGGGNTIIDSGATASSLTPPAYDIVTETLMKSLSNFKRVTVEGVPLEYCFIATGYEECLVPRLAFHFADGARFEPHVKGYIIDLEDKGVRCLGFKSNGNVIGNRMQQNHLWEFDIVGHKLGFAASTCA